MPNAVRTLLALLIALWVLGWVLACWIDVTIARWPEAAEARRTAPPMWIRWLRLLYLWPVSLYAVLGSRSAR